MSEPTRAYNEQQAIQAGRSLHVGVIGIGQCGGNMAEAFALRHYPAIAVNTSRTDLRALTRIPDDRKLLAGGEAPFGSGGSLALGGEALRAAAAGIESKVLEVFDDVELVLAIGGLGGGTGGNLAEIVNLLASQDIPVVAVGVLPASVEGHRAKTNALWAVNELIDSDLESLVLIDNDKLFARHAREGLSALLPTCNAMFVDAFDRLNGVAGDGDLRSIRTFDPNDLRQVLRFGGVTVFGSRNVDGPIDRSSLCAAFREIVNENEQLATGFELADVVALGAVLTASPSVLQATPAAVLDELARELRQLTAGAVQRTGVYAQSEVGSRFYAIAAGLPLPKRARTLLAEAGEEARHFNEKKSAARSKLGKLDLGPLGIGEGAKSEMPLAAEDDDVQVFTAPPPAGEISLDALTANKAAEQNANGS